MRCRCVGRASGFQRLSRGFRRLVALLPSLPPVRCILDCLIRACPLAPYSCPYYKSFLRRRFGSTAGTAIYLSLSLSVSLVRLSFSLPSLSLFLSISTDPFSENPAFPYQRAPSGLPEPMTQSEQQGSSSALTRLLAMTAIDNHSSHSHARLTTVGSRHASAGHWLTVSLQPDRLI